MKNAFNSDISPLVIMVFSAVCEAAVVWNSNPLTVGHRRNHSDELSRHMEKLDGLDGQQPNIAGQANTSDGSRPRSRCPFEILPDGRRSLTPSEDIEKTDKEQSPFQVKVKTGLTAKLENESTQAAVRRSQP